MIKRRFYKLEHGDKDAPSDSSSSSDDSEVEAEATDSSEEEADEDENVSQEVRQKDETASPNSGYESEESSLPEINLDSSGVPTSDEEEQNEARSFGQPNTDSLEAKEVEKEEEDDGFIVPECVLKCKSVFKCKLCPRIVCLSRETLTAHLQSKRHARSEKLLSEGRLKVMLDDDGKLEGEIAPNENSEDESPTKEQGQGGKKTRFKKKRGEHRAIRGRKRRKNNDD